MSSEIIYTRKYPRDNNVDAINDVESQSEEERREAREFIDRLAERYTYKPRPGAEHKARKFIELAQEYSEQYRVDMTIQREPHSVSAKMLIDFGPYFGHVKKDFDRLNRLADEITFIEPDGEDNRLIVYLDVITHDQYCNGKKTKRE